MINPVRAKAFFLVFAHALSFYLSINYHLSLIQSPYTAVSWSVDALLQKKGNLFHICAYLSKTNAHENRKKLAKSFILIRFRISNMIYLRDPGLIQP